ncbi:putative TPR repeat methyltransferase [Pseudorhizobium tarimense]|uniref:TPR repeat methyltransferase n=1 Tax=Pseudorhizobium tarimense TaxID=1079109 RepID=A0ABV2HE25_9HYPH|nr:methyltransferase [Pseudorhizobium tarimense]MCJ8521667.1 methyltransferase [Pseudorhizobium tarimense]
MPPSQFSSGDALADRRVEYARMLADAGDLLAATELVEQALELVPYWAAGWFSLGDYREQNAVVEGAVDAYRQALRFDPEDVFGARLKLALLGAAEVPDQPPSRYVESLFDDYAERFDKALVEKLDYSVPGKLADIVSAKAPFCLAVDLGCGTGLLGAEIRDVTERLEGFDLSANMLAKAEQKEIYDHLAQADLSLSTEEAGLLGEGLPAHRADLVTAADVLMYLGSLETVMPLVIDLLLPGGHFAFSVEEATGDEGFELRESLRYAHTEDYIRSLLTRFGFETLAMMRTDIRLDRGEPIFGMLFLSRKLP